MFQFAECLFENAYKWAKPSIQVSFVASSIFLFFFSLSLNYNMFQYQLDLFLYSPAELQYYTALYSLVIQIPCLFFLIDWGNAYSILTSENDESTQLSALLHMAFIYLINGIFFHFQTITAYVLMDFISPVTHR